MIRRKFPVINRLMPRQELFPCRHCKRTFVSDRLSVHENICRNIKTSRPVFDSAQKRMIGTGLENYVLATGKRQLQWRRGGSNYTKQKYAPTKNNWRQTHEELIQALRNARAAGKIMKMGGNINDLPPPPPSVNPNYVQCPYCLRRFNEVAGNRHIPQCAGYRHNKPNANVAPKTSKPTINYPKFRSTSDHN